MRLNLVTRTTDEIDAESPDYKEVVEAFGEERILERKQYLYVVAKDLIERHGLDPESFYISPTLIGEVVINYFADFKRLKDFHELERGNRVKIAAYLVFWVSRERPIQLIRPDYASPKARKINGLFSLTLILHILFTKGDVFTTPQNLSRFNDFQELFLYTLRYRIYTAQSLELAIQALLVEVSLYR